MRMSVSKVLVLLLLGILLGGGAFATAATLISSKDIKDSSIQNRDIRPGVITMSRLSESTQELIHKGGDAGAPGAPGQPGRARSTRSTRAHQEASAPTLTSGDFGVIYRNTIGSPVADLRSGPGDPALGSGSLSLLVAADTDTSTSLGDTEKVSYGVSIRDPLREITEVGFRVFTTAENMKLSTAANPNMPGITIEMDPNVAAIATDYTSLVWAPPEGQANEWSPYLDGTKEGLWGFTGSAFNGNKCSINGTRCTLAEAMALLNDDATPAEPITFAVTKGRDHAFQGAVDDLRLNGRTADFEEGGVVIKAS